MLCRRIAEKARKKVSKVVDAWRDEWLTRAPGRGGGGGGGGGAAAAAAPSKGPTTKGRKGKGAKGPGKQGAKGQKTLLGFITKGKREVKA